MRKQLTNSLRGKGRGLALLLFFLSTVFCLPAPVFAQSYVGPVYTQQFIGVINNNTQLPCGIPPGAPPTVQIQTAFQQDQFYAGGAVNLDCYAGPIAITADIFSPISANIIVWGGEHAITVNANATIPSNFEICFGPGGSIAAGVGYTLTNDSTACLGGAMGGGTMTSVDIIPGTNVTVSGACNSTTVINCTINSTGGSGSPGAPLYAIQVNQPLGTFAGYSDFLWNDSTQTLQIGSGTIASGTRQAIIGYSNTLSGSGDYAFGQSNTLSTLAGQCMAIGYNNTACAMGSTGESGVYIGQSGSGIGRQISIWPNNNLEGQTTISSFYHSFSTTLYNLACMYADEEMVDCGPNASNWIGITIDPSGLTATEGVVPVSSTNSAVVNDWVCTNSSGSQVTDSGSTVGCGADTYPVGVVTDIMQFGATTPIIKIARGNGAGGGGGTPGGSPTQIQYNLGGSFAGIAGSAVDTSGDVTIAPTVPTATALSVIAANDAEHALVAYFDRRWNVFLRYHRTAHSHQIRTIPDRRHQLLRL